MSQLVIGTVNFGEHAPPRGTVNRARRKVVRQAGAYNLSGSRWDFGLADEFYHVFQSQNQQGYVTPQDMERLWTLFNDGQSVTVTTDLLGDFGAAETFTGYFDYENPPSFSTPFPAGQLWAFVIPLYLKKNTPDEVAKPDSEAMKET